MAVLNLRNVPEDLMKRLRMAAVEANRANEFHAFCIEALARSLGGPAPAVETRAEAPAPIQTIEIT
jgi:hypothetical protein